MKNEIILFENQDVKLEVNMKDETVWLTQQQMADLFEKDRTVITKHINNIFKEQELDEESNVQKMHFPNSDKLVAVFSLDVIISVGYRVKSKNGIAFRKWANKILKDYMIKGYAVNQKRLEYLEKTVKLLDIANRVYENTKSDDSKEILRVITEYTKALDLLDDYDHKSLKKVDGTNNDLVITYEECLDIIDKLRFNSESNLFALERDNNFKSIINDIYQSFGGADVYSTVQEKCANLLYLVVKDHAFIDGNKRIAATLFIYFLQRYNILYDGEKQVIDNNTLTAMTLLIAESNPKEKNIMIDLILNFLK